MDGREMHANQLPRVLLFGGTSEGRALAEWLGARGTCEVVTSSLTEYGGSLVDGIAHVHALVGRMLPEQMDALMRSEEFACVVDATHPYAVEVTKSIAASARACGLPCYRVVREGEPAGPWKGFDNAEKTAAYLAQREGKVLLTTGSKDLGCYVRAMPDYRERLFIRILPVAASLAAADELGIPASHVIAMQGPFSRDFNAALLRELGIGIMVTKASGAAGGFWEKVEAARMCDVELLVVHRPVAEEGLSLAQVQEKLAKAHGM